ncbi:MAG TPA: hypothetical protein VFA49_10020 [Chloroflexota bacterium]|nr:hypothetical protein [Chloroflexota bacterium]
MTRSRSVVARASVLRAWAMLSAVLVLGIAANWLPQLVGEIGFFRANGWPLLRLWSQPIEQARLAAGPELVDVFFAADLRLPADARVALLTTGQDVDGREYVTYHRALYYLSPRSVWWLVEAPPVESERRPRWYTEVPRDDDAAVVARARRLGAQWLLGFGVEREPAPGTGSGAGAVRLENGPGAPTRGAPTAAEGAAVSDNSLEASRDAVSGVAASTVEDSTTAASTVRPSTTIAPSTVESSTDLGSGWLVWLGDGAAPATPEPRPELFAGPAWPIALLGAVAVLFGLGWLGVGAVQRLGLDVGLVEGLALAWVLGSVGVSLVLLLGCAFGLGLRGTSLATAVLGVCGAAYLRRAALVAVWRGLSAASNKVALQSRPGATLADGARAVPAGLTGGMADSPSANVAGSPSAHAASWRSGKSAGSLSGSAAGSSSGISAGWRTDGSATGLLGRLAAVVLVAGLGLVVVYVGLLADGRPLQVWDSWVTWGMKARLIWQTDTVPPGVYADPTRAVTLLNYPLLLPLLEAWLYAWVEAPDDRLAGLAVVSSYAALLGMAFAAVRNRGASVIGGLLAATYLASIWALAGLAGLAFADVPLALFGLVAGVYLVRWLEGGSPGALCLAAVAAGALGWTKREGLVLLVLFVLASLLVRRRRGAELNKIARPAGREAGSVRDLGMTGQGGDARTALLVRLSGLQFPEGWLRRWG